MKKTLTLLIVLSALCTILAACSPAAPALDGGSASLAPAASPTPTASPAPAATPGPVELRKGVEAMMPILDSILNTMGMTDTTPYAPKDADFFWSVLYLTGVNWGHTHPLIEYNNVHAIIPSQVMQEFTGKTPEQMKAERPTAWIQRMTNIRNRVEETILNDLIYS